jgi:GT2 family glycosyltransferase
VTLSVVIATYCRPDGLRRAVESLRRQSRPPDQIVVALWSGDAPTTPVARELASPTRGMPLEQPTITLVEVDDRRLLPKENQGMGAATGDIVCFLDDDAVARPAWLERIARHYADPTVGGVGGRDVIWHADQAPETPVRAVGRLSWFGRLDGNHHRSSKGLRDVEFLKGCNMSFRRELLPQLDHRLAGEIPYGFEVDLGLAVRAQARRIVYDPEASVDHYASSDMTAARTGLSYVVNHNQTYILLKHLPWWRRMAFLLYTFLIGDRNTIGLLRVPMLALRDHWSREALTEHFRGKIDGIRTFRTWRRVAGETP